MQSDCVQKKKRRDRNYFMRRSAKLLWLVLLLAPPSPSSTPLPSPCLFIPCGTAMESLLMRSALLISISDKGRSRSWSKQRLKCTSVKPSRKAAARSSFANEYDHRASTPTNICIQLQNRTLRGGNRFTVSCSRRSARAPANPVPAASVTLISRISTPSRSTVRWLKKWVRESSTRLAEPLMGGWMGG